MLAYSPMKEINKLQLDFVLKLRLRLLDLRDTHKDFFQKNNDAINHMCDGLSQTAQILSKDSSDGAESFPNWFINDFAQGFNVLTECIRDTVAEQYKLPTTPLPEYVSPDPKQVAFIYTAHLTADVQKEFVDLSVDSPPVGPLFKA